MSQNLTQVKGYQTLVLPDNQVVFVRLDSVEGLSKLDTLLFDLDGVILDPTLSIQQAHPKSLQFWAENFADIHNAAGLITPADVAAFKLSGGFNDDWNIAAASGLIYLVKKEAFATTDGQVLKDSGPSLAEMAGAGSKHSGGVDGIILTLPEYFEPAAVSKVLEAWDQKFTMRIFMEIVSGENCQEMYGFKATHYSGKGLICEDRLLVDPRNLDLPYKLGVYTGRTLGEVNVGFRQTGLTGWPPSGAIITVDDGMPKPNGKPLELLCRKLQTVLGAFIGDNPDDLRSAQLYRSYSAQPFYGIQVTFGEHEDAAREMFLNMQADMVASDLATVSKALYSLREGIL